MKTAFYTTVVILVVAVVGFVVIYTQSSATIDDLNDKYVSAVSQVSSITSERDSANAEVLNLTTELSAVNDELLSATLQLSILQDENDNLKETITPSSPAHKLSQEEISGSTTYWNIAWDDAELQQTARDVNTSYFEWHTYIAGETDCNDMAVDIWDMLKKRGIIALIAIGNLKLESETFAQCDHTWLVIIGSTGKAFALEPTNGQLYFKGDSNAEQYMHFFIYAKPSDLRADLGSRW